MTMRSLPMALALGVLATLPLNLSATAQNGPQEASSTPATTTLPTNYVIGPDDVLGVVFWREPEMSGDVTVRPDGKVTLPLLGEITAAGLTPAALQQSVEDAADRFLADANVNVVVRQVNSRKVFITGQVAQPGAFSVTSPRTVLQLIALAGGLTEFAKANQITIMRVENGKTKTFKFDYKKVSKGEALEQNIELAPGDTVVVP